MPERKGSFLLLFRCGPKSPLVNANMQKSPQTNKNSMGN